MGRPKINYALAATLIAQGVTLPEVAATCGAKSAEVLRVGLNRKGVTVRGARVLPVPGCSSTSVTMQVASAASQALRSTFSDILAAHAGKLAEIPAKANLKHLAQVGAAMEPLARTAKIVHDWGSEQPNALVVAGLFAQPTPQESPEPATDIQAVVVERYNPKPSIGDQPNTPDNQQVVN